MPMVSMPSPPQSGAFTGSRDHIRRLGTPPAPQGIGELIVHPITPQPIGVVTIYPGISADVVRNFLRQPVKALILRSYGVGNAPQNGEFIQVLAEASQRGSWSST